SRDYDGERHAVRDPVHCLPYRLKADMFKFDLYLASPKLMQDDAGIVGQIFDGIEKIYQPKIEFFRLVEGIELPGDNVSGERLAQFHDVQTSMERTGDIFLDGDAFGYPHQLGTEPSPVLH